MTDVNVTAKAADRIARARGYVQGACVDEHYRDAREALAALADPEVLAGIAGVLREHGLVRAAYRDPSYGPGIVCRCGAVVDQALDEAMQETQARHVATAVADWLRGTGDDR